LFSRTCAPKHTQTHTVIIIIIIIIIISLISVESEHAIGTAELNTIAKYNSEFCTGHQDCRLLDIFALGKNYISEYGKL